MQRFSVVWQPRWCAGVRASVDRLLRLRAPQSVVQEDPEPGRGHDGEDICVVVDNDREFAFPVWTFREGCRHSEAASDIAVNRVLSGQSDHECARFIGRRSICDPDDLEGSVPAKVERDEWHDAVVEASIFVRGSKHSRETGHIVPSKDRFHGVLLELAGKLVSIRTVAR